MVRRCLAYAVVATCATVVVSPLHAGPRAIIELFTSQGCSSCPAADKLLAEMTGDPAIVALSLPIDVWDYLGWHDTLASPRNTARWQAYSKSRGDRERYTPQVVINGAIQALGSSREAIEKAITDSHHNASVMSVPVTLSSDGRQMSASVGEGGAAGVGAAVWIAGLSRVVTVAVLRGENKGRRLSYHNVVRSWTRFETWNGKASRWTIPAHSLNHEGVDAAVIMIQTGSAEMPSFMLGAAIAPLH